ncbi:hypothetical protein IQ274_06875 [Nostoc sp. LEGE 12447]|uniref:hypothetical protein n=1 Tax=Nostoc sp. LEGE 12447 TaxID=1828640 RepID=UPI0018831811|nr:hypothetical protein [Nostoc sp. LEGE 12447]MBE8997944.1 hypothetical protein [Nostoc sp. LEGE 12447]
MTQTVITIGSIVTAETSPQLAATIKAPAANSYLVPDKNNQYCVAALLELTLGTHSRFFLQKTLVSFLQPSLRLLLPYFSADEQLKNLNYTINIRKTKLKLGKIVKI